MKMLKGSKRGSNPGRSEGLFTVIIQGEHTGEHVLTHTHTHTPTKPVPSLVRGFRNKGIVGSAEAMKRRRHS